MTLLHFMDFYKYYFYLWLISALNMKHIHDCVCTVRAEKEPKEAPAKLLDDLFCKTKTTPCIYWLPLTAQQV